MSIQFVAGKLKGEERKAIIQGVQKQMQEVALGAIKPLLTEFCEEELTVKLGRGKREPRRVADFLSQVSTQQVIESRECLCERKAKDDEGKPVVVGS